MACPGMPRMLGSVVLTRIQVARRIGNPVGGESGAGASSLSPASRGGSSSAIVMTQHYLSSRENCTRFLDTHLTHQARGWVFRALHVTFFQLDLLRIGGSRKLPA